ncbi:MAG TPA: ribosome maturation factor RimM [Micropepsaceae bacterium]|nr:ribosome maturation factor RimM [Micropepsaceae bacterium]
MPDDILVGRITGPHGLGGEVKVQSFTQDPLSIGSYGPLAVRMKADGAVRTLTIARIKRAKDHLIVRFAGISDRNGAEALKGAELFVARAQLPAAGEGEFYLADLEGLAVRDAQGREIGRIQTISDFGGGPILVIATPEGGEMMLPFADDFIAEINVAGGFICVHVPGEIEARGEEDEGAP